MKKHWIKVVRKAMLFSDENPGGALSKDEALHNVKPDNVTPEKWASIVKYIKKARI